jgi:hypothetical protein
MTREAIEAVVVFVGAVVAIAGARAWMARTDDLKLGIFRPWRGDPWPIGVQEDDDFRFNWTAAARSSDEGSPLSGGRGIRGTRGAAVAPGDDAPDHNLIEDVAGHPVSVEHVSGINVRRTGS